jgi:PAS domain S-box-containing protein
VVPVPGLQPISLRKAWLALAKGLGLTVAYVAAVNLGQAFGVLYDGYAPFWPAAGVGSGGLAVLGTAYAPAVAIGSLIEVLPKYPLPAALWFTFADTLEPVLVALLLRRLAVDYRLSQPKDVVRFSCAAIAGGLVNAGLNAPAYVAYGPSPTLTVAGIVVGWTIGNAIGHMAVGGTILVLYAGRAERLRAGLAERVVIAAATVAASAWVFLVPRAAAVPRLYVVLALVTWTAVRLGQRAIGLAVLGISALAAWAVTRGTGPFAPSDGPALQVFLGVYGLAAFGIAAVAAEREQAATLRERESSYRVLADASPNLMWMARATGGVEFVNAKTQEYFGLRGTGHEWLAFVHAEDRPALVQAWTDATTRGIPMHLEIRLRRADGSTRWHLLFMVPVTEEPDHDLRWVGTATDIHDRKLAELELESWQRHYERAQAIGQLGSWESPRPSSGPIVWSSELYRIFGVEPSAFDGRVESFYALVHPDDRAAVERAAATAIAGGARYSIDHRIVRSDGEVRWVHEEADISEARDGTRRLVGICRDITDRVRAEAERRTLEASLLQAQKLESLGILAGGIAHDFNNLLVGILGNASLALLDLPGDAPAREAIERIEISSQRAADLVRQMLAYSGKAAMTLERVDASALVKEMGDLLTTAISKKASIRYSLAPDLPSVEADATQLRQVVMNLITNASDAISDAGGSITIGTSLVTPATPETGAAGTVVVPGTYVAITVSDTGVGMDDETATRIFDPFFSTKFAGRGLGLAAVQGIVRSHRGSIRVESAPGRGTTFTVLVPASTGGAAAATGAARPVTAASLEGTALVVDDEEAVRQAITLMLQRAGLQVVGAAGGHEALARFHELRDTISVVVLDLTMPDLGGPEVLASLRRVAPRVPVILVSGYSRDDAVGAVDASGDNGPQVFLQKPFRPQELADAVRAAMEAARTTAA